MTTTTKKQKALHVVQLTVENVKRIQALSITPNPDDALVVLGGRNAQGKTSTLDAIEMALGGKKTLPPDPVRHGARKARIVVDLGDIIVERTISPKGTELVVTNKAGERQKGPQELLDALCSRVSFDPLAFARWEPKKQDAVLREVLGLDFSALDADRKTLFDARTDLGRNVKQLEARLAVLPMTEAGLPESELQSADVLKEIDDLMAEKEKQRKTHELLAALMRDLDDAQSDVKRAEERIAELEQQLRDARVALDKSQELSQGLRVESARIAKTVEALPVVDIEKARAKMATIDETNRKVRAAAERRALDAEIAAKSKRLDELTAGIEGIDAKKQSLLAAAKFPVDGLGFDETGPTLNGSPLEQASSAEKLRLSVAIGAALNPGVRVMLLRDGSLLDSESMKQLAQLAAQTDSQIWVERVSEDGAGCAVVIEDGCARIVDETQAEAGAS